MEKKKSEDSLRDHGTTLNAPTLALQMSQKEKREKGPEKIFEKIITEKFPDMGKEIINKLQKAQNTRQDKSNEEYTETHSN